MLAALRASPAKRHRPASEVSPETPRSLPRTEPNFPRAIPGPSPETRCLNAEATVPDRSTQEILQNVFFTYLFNAALTFHRPTYHRRWLESGVPQHQVLAVCAMATRFLASPTVFGRYSSLRLRHLGDIRELGRGWALLASKEVLQRVDQPTLDTIQTCEVLTYYWFAMGEMDRSMVFSGITYKGARWLVNEKRLRDSRTGPSNLSNIDHLDWIESETTRRCFWAAWSVHCINGDEYIVGSSADRFILNIPLPTKDNFHEDKASQERLKFSNFDGLTPANARIASVCSVSAMTEHLMLILHWTKIRDLIESKQSLSSADFLAKMFALDADLTQWESKLSPTLVYSKRNLYDQLVMKHQPVYFLMHTLIHQSRVVLNSSVVPQFTGSPLPDKMPTDMVKLSARSALLHAKAISNMGADLLALDWDTTQLAPFVGYCMYVSAVIQVRFIFAQESTLATSARAGLMSSLKVLEAMKPCWKNLERFWQRALFLYRAELIKHASSNDGESAVFEETPLGWKDMDQVIHAVKDSEEFQEPLADSVLQYRLSVREDLNNIGNARPIKNLENALQEDYLVHLARNLSSSTRGSNGRASLQRHDTIPISNFISHNTANHSVDSQQLLASNSSGSDLDASTGSQEDENFNWSSWDAELWSTATLSMNDLFGIF